MTTNALKKKKKKAWISRCARTASDGQHKQTPTRTKKFHGKWDLLLLKYVEGIYPGVNS